MDHIGISKELLFFLLAVFAGIAGFFGMFLVKSLGARMKAVEHHGVEHAIKIASGETNVSNMKNSINEIKVDVKEIKRLLEKKS